MTEIEYNEQVLNYYYDNNKIIDIYYIIKDNGVNIINSYDIVNDHDKIKFLHYIYETYGNVFGKRDYYSLLVEWKAHNILYKKGILKKRTKDSGLYSNESWIRKIFYKMVCFIFKEK